MNPTKEQKTALDMAMTGKTAKITAYAGAGKTSTLKLIGNAKSHQQGMYLAFNKAIATEAQSKFGNNVNCKTFHSMAYNSVPRWLTGKLRNTRSTPMSLAVRYSLEGMMVPVELTSQRTEKDTSRSMTAKQMANAMINTVGYYCRSNHAEIQKAHAYTALPSWIESTSRAELANMVLHSAKKYWDDLLNPELNNRIEHDHYLKYWASYSPRIMADFILFDEAQDADPIMLNVLTNQNAQVIYVGDRHQQIYGFRGAINAMQTLDIAETRLSQSFRFGQEIADLANGILFNVLDETMPLRGFDQIDSRVCKVNDEIADAFIYRTNASALSSLVSLAQIGRTPKLSADVKSLEFQLLDAKKLQEGIQVKDGSIFEGFTTWSEAVEFSKEISHNDIAPLIGLIERVGIEPLLKCVRSSLGNEQNHDCIVTTAHKSKGLEFNKVVLGGDFFYKDAPKPDEPVICVDEARLLYVATTRAKKELDITALNALFEKIGKVKS